MTRRKLLLTGAAGTSAAVLAAIAWEVTRSPTPKHTSPIRRSPIWQTDVPVGPGALIAAAQDVVCIAGGNGADGNMVRALGIKDGTRRWSYAADISVINLVAATAQEIYVNAPFLTALHASNGATAWQLAIYPGLGITPSGDSIYTATGFLLGIRDTEGKIAWRVNATAASAAVVAQGVVYVLAAPKGNLSNVRELYALRAGDGAQIWSSRTPGLDSASLATDGTFVCAVDAANLQQPASPVTGGKLWVWRASDGRPLWTSDANGGFGAPAMAAGVIYAVGVNSELYALRASDGTRIWSRPADTAITPVVANGLVYAANPAGQLIVLRASDGTPAWQFPTSFSVGPVVAGHAVYVSDGTKVYALAAE